MTTVITAIITAVVGFYSGMKYERRSKKQAFSQHAGNSSQQYQAGRDQTITK